jgi:hypothetical protein
VNAALELLKSGRLAFRIEGDDLSVQDELAARLAAPRPRFEGGGDLRELMRLLVTEARPDPDPSSGVDLDDRPDPVVLRLVDQMRIGQRGVGQRR